jgi:Lar family restriction alleviation protein
MSKEPKIVPCPFCGGEGRVRIDIKFHYWITCVECESTGSIRYSESKAIEVWNTRKGQKT